jgi:glycosyltransferase involved in cell wall biosynthesis
MKIKIIQQVYLPYKGGGVGREFYSLMENENHFKFKFVPLILTKKQGFINIKQIKEINQFFKKENPEIIQIRGGLTDCINTLIAAKLFNKAKIYTVIHGLNREIINYNFFKRIISIFIIEPLIFLVSDFISFVYKGGEKRFFILLDKRKVLQPNYNHCPDWILPQINKREEFKSQFTNTYNKLLGIYVGRINYEKGLFYLAKALLEIDKNNDLSNKLKFHFIGEGPYLEKMKEMLKPLILKKTVEFFGFQENVKDYLFAADFFVSPSLHENFSISILEAQFSMLPVIATDVGGNKQIVNNNITGFLIKARSSIALIRKIKEVLNMEKNNLENMKIQSHKIIYSNFNKFKLLNILNDNYKKILKIDKVDS